MENSFILSCESAVDLPFSYIDRRKISVIFYTYTINGELYTDNMQQDPNDLKDFYEKLDGGVIVKTSQINEFKYSDKFASAIAFSTSDNLPTPDGSIKIRSGLYFSITSFNDLEKSPTKLQQIHP